MCLGSQITISQFREKILPRWRLKGLYTGTIEAGHPTSTGPFQLTCPVVARNRLLAQLFGCLARRALTIMPRRRRSAVRARPRGEGAMARALVEQAALTPKRAHRVWPTKDAFVIVSCASLNCMSTMSSMKKKPVHRPVSFPFV